MEGRKNERFLILLASFLFFANFFVWQAVFAIENNLKVIFFDVGQGDSIFIETSYGHQILIDGGPSREKIARKIAKVMPAWDRSIDLLILTHQDFDHLSGVLEIMQRYEIKNIIWNGQEVNSSVFKEWQELLNQSEANIFIAEENQSIQAGKAVLQILYPFKENNFSSISQNNASVVLKMTFGSIDFLLTGDAEQKIEKELLERYGDFLQAKVFKAGHHGSKTSNSAEFLRLVEPKLVVVSVGMDNKYGHPNKEVLQRFSDFAIKVLRTDQLGDITIKTNGQDFWWK